MKRICFMFAGILVYLVLALVACAPELKSANDAGTTDGDGGPPPTRTVPGQAVTTTDLGKGVTQVVVNASDSEKWIYFSFAKGVDVAITDEANSKEWDIAFSRNNIKSNGGENGAGGVEVAIVDGKELDEVTAAPKDGYITGKADKAQYVFAVQDGWYIYNVFDHTLTPRKRVYIVKTATTQYIKMQMSGYYNDAKESGFPAFKWSEIAAP